MSKDTVLELRRLADKMAGTTAVIVFNSTLRDAADEIERLRVQALGTQRRMQDQDAIMAELWERIHALTTERDEARRWICEQKAAMSDRDASWWAGIHTWDCFKEDSK